MWDEITYPFPNFNGATVEYVKYAMSRFLEVPWKHKIGLPTDIWLSDRFLLCMTHGFLKISWTILIVFFWQCLW